jgi:rubrerythrin
MSRNISDDSQGDTGTRDITYNLVSTIYHALQGAETEALYIADAEQHGDEELAQFFREVKMENQRRAERAKQLLGRYLAQGGQQGQAASGG